MGKFDGVILVSDFDNTLLYTDPVIQRGEPSPPQYPRNLQAIQHWMEEGGVFAVATGRSLAAYHRQGEQVPTNAPTIVDNGAAIYDMRTEEYLVTNFLPDTALHDVAWVLEQYPSISTEIYVPGRRAIVMRPVPWNDQHALLSGTGYDVVDRLDETTIPGPMIKALLIGKRTELEAIRDVLVGKGWGERYEFIFSSDVLLELTAKGFNKGSMVRKLADMTGCTKIICAGDHLNDLPMLQVAHRAFCPANSQPEVLSAPGVTTVCHCRDGAIGEIVDILEAES